MEAVGLGAFQEGGVTFAMYSVKAKPLTCGVIDLWTPLTTTISSMSCCLVPEERFKMQQKKSHKNEKGKMVNYKLKCGSAICSLRASMRYAHLIRRLVKLPLYIFLIPPLCRINVGTLGRVGLYSVSFNWNVGCTPPGSEGLSLTLQD